MTFDGCENILFAFGYLTSYLFGAQINQPYDTVRGWCKQYCDEHWHDETLDWNVSSLGELQNILNTSFYHNPLNPGLLKFIANKLGDTRLMNSVKNYEKEFSCKKIEDFIKEIRK